MSPCMAGEWDAVPAATYWFCAAATARSALLEIRTGERPQGVGVDEVVGLVARAHRLGVVLQLQLLERKVRLAQRAVALGALRVDLADRGQAVEGRLDRDPCARRVVAREVLDGDEPALLDVDNAVQLLTDPETLGR